MSSQTFDLKTQFDIALAAAEAALTAGGLVVMPTDTVYGIGADAFNADAIARLLAAKGRGRDMPVPVLIGEPAVMTALAREIPAGAQALADFFWPGALSLILPVQPSLAMDLGDAVDTIMVRVPADEDARALLRRVGPMGVSSANTTGMPPAQNAARAREMLGESVAVYLEGAPAGDTPSTIVDFAADTRGIVRRKGVLTMAELRAVSPDLVDPDEA